MTTRKPTEQLKREIGPRGLALASVNIMVGSGIFALPALVAEGLGATAIVAYLCCGALIFLLALCFAEIGSHAKTSGGVYHYVEGAFGPYAGFIGSAIYWVGCCIADAAIANVLADLFRSFIPALRIDGYRMIFLLALFGGLAWLNIRSVKSGLRFVLFASMGKLLPLIVLVMVATPAVEVGNLAWEIEPTFGNIGPATLLLFFAFQGFEVPLCNGGEIKDPSRTVPLGILGGVLMVLVLYISIQLVTQGSLGDQLGVHKDAPLAAVAAVVLGNGGIFFIVAVTILSTLGSLSGSVLSIPRVLYASAADGLLPRQLAKVHPRFATPYVAIGVYVAVDLLLALSGGFRQLAVLSSASSLLLYLGVALACIRKRAASHQEQKGFRMPGGILIPVVATIATGWVISNLVRAEVIGISVFVGVVSVIYWTMVLLKKRRSKKQAYITQ